MKLWQVLSAVIIFKGADLALAATSLEPDHKLAIVGIWFFVSVVVWFMASAIAMLIEAFASGEWREPDHFRKG